MIISLFREEVIYWPGEEEEVRKWDKLGYTLIPLDKNNVILHTHKVLPRKGLDA